MNEEKKCTCHLDPSFAALDERELSGSDCETFERFSVEDAEGFVVARCPDMACAELIAHTLNVREGQNSRFAVCLLHP